MMLEIAIFGGLGVALVILFVFDRRQSRRAARKVDPMVVWARSQGAKHKPVSVERLHVGGYDVLVPGNRYAFHALRHWMLGDNKSGRFEAYEMQLAWFQDLMHMAHFRVVALPLADDVSDFALRTHGFPRNAFVFPGIPSAWPPNDEGHGIVLYSSDPSGAPFPAEPALLEVMAGEKARALVARGGILAVVESGEMTPETLERQLAILERAAEAMQPQARWLRA